MGNTYANKYYQIGEVSKICNIPIRTLHHYNDIGLLKPKKIDSSNNYRYYSHEQLLHIRIIKDFKAEGFSLKAVGELLKRDDIDFNKKMLDLKCIEIDKTISELEMLRKKLKVYVEGMEYKENETIIDNNIHIKEIMPLDVAYLRYKGSWIHEEFITVFSELYKLIEKNNLKVIGTRLVMFNENYLEIDYSDSHIEICIPINKTTEIPGLVRKLDGFEAVVATHYGKYSNIQGTYKLVRGFIKNTEYKLQGNVIHNHIIDAGTTINREKYITEVIFPVIKI
ncbi:MerR family transcriptional regulator [Clostridium gasigenes]|uniref:MerR family transcriptional regulator n=1 Tax=Clostridium gasigenes TaxID=94869 RepID=A0A7X0VQK1_9CLOT|nr:MerR family transcriptional regulator [Clostridium gasigenes]MBB6714063.1 MerR family transcriptional regulator [Clostridium gasigenes]